MRRCRSGATVRCVYGWCHNEMVWVGVRGFIMNHRSLMVRMTSFRKRKNLPASFTRTKNFATNFYVVEKF
jgi:hypothetical protein